MKTNQENKVTAPKLTEAQREVLVRIGDGARHGVAGLSSYDFPAGYQDAEEAGLVQLNFHTGYCWPTDAGRAALKEGK